MQTHRRGEPRRRKVPRLAFAVPVDPRNDASGVSDPEGERWKVGDRWEEAVDDLCMAISRLPGFYRDYADRTRAADRTIAAPLQSKAVSGQSAVTIDPDLQLTLSRDDDYKSVHIGHLKSAENGLPKRETWRIRRVGRVQMPYAAAMLESLTGSMSRRAFDLDFARARSTTPLSLDSTSR